MIYEYSIKNLQFLIRSKTRKSILVLWNFEDLKDDFFILVNSLFVIYFFYFTTTVIWLPVLSLTHRWNLVYSFPSKGIP